MSEQLGLLSEGRQICPVLHGPVDVPDEEAQGLRSVGVDVDDDRGLDVDFEASVTGDDVDDASPTRPKDLGTDTYFVPLKLIVNLLASIKGTRVVATEPLVSGDDATIRRPGNEVSSTIKVMFSTLDKNKQDIKKLHRLKQTDRCNTQSISSRTEMGFVYVMRASLTFSSLANSLTTEFLNSFLF